MSRLTQETTGHGPQKPSTLARRRKEFCVRHLERIHKKPSDEGVLNFFQIPENYTRSFRGEICASYGVLVVKHYQLFQ